MTQLSQSTTPHSRALLGLLAIFAVFAAAVFGTNRLMGDTAQAQTGTASVTIVKQGLVGEDVASFTHDFEAGGTFDLSAAEPSVTFTDLAPGTYHVTELPLEGYVLTGTGCSLDAARAAPSLDAVEGNTLGVTVAEGQAVTCTFFNGSTQVLQYDVTVAKYVDGAAAIEGSFDFTATWTAGNLDGGVETSGDFVLDSSNLWMIESSPMDAGASYAVVENGIDATCDEGDAYSLLGYGLGATIEEAAAATPADAAAIADLQADQYIVAFNESCKPVGTSTLTIVKEGLEAGGEAVFTHDVPGQPSDTFTLTFDAPSITLENLAAATYTFVETASPGYEFVTAGCAFTPLAPAEEPQSNTLSVVLGEDEDQTCTFVNELDTNTVTINKYLDGAAAADGTFDFTETVDEASATFTLDSANAFAHTTEPAAFGAAYGLVEDGIDATCDEGDTYRLVGYSVGATIDEALAAPASDTVEIASLEADTFVVVWNQSCDSIASITIVKNFDPDSTAEASFTVEGAGLEDFTIAEGEENGRTFANLNAGSYTFTEGDIESWMLQSIFCAGQSSPSNILINLGGASVTVTINPGDDITCTFTNISDGTEPEPGTGGITIVKDWSTEEAGPDATFTTSSNLGIEGDTFDLVDDGAEGDMLAFADLPVDLYSFSEADLEGWTLTSIICNGQDSPDSITIDLALGMLDVDLSDGETIVCTFTNTLDATAPEENTDSVIPFSVPNLVDSNILNSPVPSVNTDTSNPSANLPSANAPSANDPLPGNVTNNAPDPSSNVVPAPVSPLSNVDNNAAPSANTADTTADAQSNVAGEQQAPAPPSAGNTASSSESKATLLLFVGLALVAGASATVAYGMRRR